MFFWFERKLLDIAVELLDEPGAAGEVAEGSELILWLREWATAGVGRSDVWSVRPRPIWLGCIAAVIAVPSWSLSCSSIASFIVAVLLASSLARDASSWPTQKSQNTHPRTVPVLPQPATVMGELLSWYMTMNEQIKIATAQRCCTTTVKSETKGQKS